MRFRPKILVVEDDEAMLRLLGTVLGELGVETCLLSNSQSAAKLVDHEKFDGVFLDWRMPNMDGLELTRHIRRSKSNQKVPIVMLTGVATRKAVEDCFRAGVNFFLQKPVSVAQVRHLLNASRGQMLEERRRYQRAPARLSMRVRWNGQERKATSVNLSASGVLLEITDPPAVRSRVEMEFELPGQPGPLRLSGTVVREAPGLGVGVRFDFARREDQNVLKDFVDRTLAKLDVS